MKTMSKIFIYSNSIGTYTFLYTAEWLLDGNVETIITTDETVFEQIVDNFNFKIKYFNSIDKCVCNCDLIIIYNDRKLPDEVINNIKKLSAIQNKKYIEIDCSKRVDSVEGINYKFINGNNFGNPAVVIFSFGQTTIPIKTELDINRIFVNARVKINQFLSPYSNNIAREYKDAGINRDKADLFNYYNHVNVSVYFLDLDNTIYSLNKYYDLLSSISPDYIIVLTDYDFLEPQMFL